MTIKIELNAQECERVRSLLYEHIADLEDDGRSESADSKLLAKLAQHIKKA